MAHSLLHIWFEVLFLVSRIRKHLIDSFLAISNYFGTDTTKGGIEWQLRAIKAHAKRQRDCFNNGGDPQTLSIGADKGTSSLLRFLSSTIQKHMIL
jgi:hypothetical protein